MKSNRSYHLQINNPEKNKPLFGIYSTENGFDVDIFEGVEVGEAAQALFDFLKKIPDFISQYPVNTKLEPGTIIKE